MNRKFISHSNFILRKVLNSKENLDIIRDFIEAILNIEIETIELNPYLESMEKYLPKEENFGIADVRIKLKNTQELNIGIQFIDGYYIENKILLYYAQIHTNQLEYDRPKKLAKTITINILDFEYFGLPDYHKKKYIETKVNGIKKGEKLEIHTIELPKFKYIKSIPISKEEEWMIYLTGDKSELVKEVEKRNPKIRKLNNLLQEYWEKETMQ